MNHEAQNPIQSVYTTFDIIETLKRLNGATVTEVAEELERPQSTIHNYLSSLRDRGYVVQDGTNYNLALRFSHIGDFTKHRLELTRVARPTIEQLAVDSGGTVNLLVEENGLGVYLAVSRGRTAGPLSKYAYTRNMEYLHCTAAGKAILASMPPECVEQVLDIHGLPAQTAETITEREVLLEELEQVRTEGYAVNDEENTQGLRAIGSPVKMEADRYAAISISGSPSRLRGAESEIAEMLQEATNTMKLDLTF